jgi:hypothetical protein
MPLDRNRLVQLLDQLSDANDETALAAAREAGRLVAESGQGWSALIEASAGSATRSVEAAVVGASGDKSSDQKLIERLLARSDISDTLRGDLEDFKRQAASGKLDPMDADYLRALAKRLGA